MSIKVSHNLIISLKSSSIDLQLVQKQSDGHAQILLSVRNIIFLSNSQDPALYTQQYFTELKSLFSKYSLDIKKKIGTNSLEVHFIFYAPWFTSQIESISHLSPVVVDENFLNKKLESIVSKNNLKIIEKRVLKIEVNGYVLTEFTKVKSSNLKIDTYTSYISQKIYSNFKKIIDDNFQNIKNIVLKTSPLLFLDKIKEYMIHEDNIMILYVGGEITELNIVKEDSLVYFATFPIGKHDFLRSIEKNIKTYDYTILNQKEIKIKSKKQEIEFEGTKKKWSDSLCALLKDFNEHIPSKILIISDIKTRAFFGDLLGETILQDKDSVLKKYRIINFDISVFKDIISSSTPTGENEVDLILESLT